jgi:betaine-homocysteine S-methyltransferase
MKRDLLERLKDGLVLCAEGYLFELERRCHLKAGPFVPDVVLDNPDALKQVHREFLAAGSDVIEAFSYYGDKEHMKDIGRLDEYEELNRQAVRLAREVAKEGDALVAGNISNIWKHDEPNRKNKSKVQAMYEEQVLWATEEGAEFIIAETLQLVWHAELALQAIKTSGLPAVVTFGTHTDSSDDGHLWIEACQIMADAGADVVGLNCTRGPATMLSFLREIRDAVNIPVAALPVPYRTTEKEQTFQSFRVNDKQVFPTKLERFLMDRDEVAEFALLARELGIEYIGLCCGAQPYHIRAMAEALGRTPPASKYSPDFRDVVGKSLKNFARR